MPLRIAINGFGRIGRLVLRAAHEQGLNDIEWVAINDLGRADAHAHLFAYDSTHGRYSGTVNTGDDWFNVGSGPIVMFNQPDPSKLPWDALDIDLVIEATGRFTSKSLAQMHLDAGAKRVLISAPAKDVEKTIVFGINDHLLDASDTIVSNASCTTNCLVPLVKILDDFVGLDRGYMTTVHSFTGDQPTIDGLHRDPRRGRTPNASMVPTTTGAMKALEQVLPEMKGRLLGSAVRVPTPNVSLIDLTFDAAKPTSSEAINAHMEALAQGKFSHIMETNSKPLVSIDFNHTKPSMIFDLTQTEVIDHKFVRVVAWYDNEWAFSHRILDTARVIGSFI